MLQDFDEAEAGMRARWTTADGGQHRQGSRQQTKRQPDADAWP